MQVQSTCPRQQTRADRNDAGVASSVKVLLHLTWDREDLHPRRQDAQADIFRKGRLLWPGWPAAGHAARLVRATIGTKNADVNHLGPWR